MTKSELIISVSGLRGIVGDSLTADVANRLGKAYASHLSVKDTLIIGGDTRQSFSMLKEALIKGILSTGVSVIDIGQCPTPTVQQAIRYHQAAGGMVITASHNPIEWNGIKLMNHQGAFLIGKNYDHTFELFHQQNFRQVDQKDFGTTIIDKQAIQRHITHIFKHLDISSIQSSKLRILIDVNHGAGAIADPLLFDQLGVDYEIMYPEADGNFSHTPEPLKQNLSAIIQRLEQESFDIGFVQDPDADRLVILAGNGTYIGEDYSLAYCIDYLLKDLNNNEAKQVVVNLSTSKVIEFIAKKHQANLHYSKIGEPNVTALLQKTGAQVGGEGNGGVIFPKVGWGRDSLLGMVVALKHLAESKRSVLDTVTNYPQFFMYRDKIQLQNKSDISNFLQTIQSKISAKSIDTQDGVKLDFGDAWLHVRASNTEPIVRLFAEATSIKQAKFLVSQAKDLL